GSRSRAPDRPRCRRTRASSRPRRSPDRCRSGDEPDPPAPVRPSRTAPRRRDGFASRSPAAGSSWLTPGACSMKLTQGRAASPPLRSSPAIGAVSLDHLVGAGEQALRHLEAERLGCLEIDNQFVVGGILYRQLGRLRALEDAIDVQGGLPVLLRG